MLIVLQVGCRDRAFGASSLGAPVRSSARPGPGPGPGPPPKSVGCEGGGDAQGGAPVAGRPPRGCRAFRESRSSMGAVPDGMTAGAAVFYGQKRKRHQSQ